MSTIKDTLEAIRDTIKLVEEVKRTTDKLSDLTIELREIDRRVSRLEGKWEAAIELGRIAAKNKPKTPLVPKRKADE